MAKKKKFSKKAHEFALAMPSMPKHMDKYEIEDAARTMERHQEIKLNKKLHTAAVKHLKKKHALVAKAIKAR